MSILKLKPSCKDYLWGGHRLAEEYGVEYDGEILAEAWELSCHPDGPSTIVNGAHAGKTLEQYIESEGREVLGTHCRRFRDFPILIKFIDAKQNLSIQVHPDNRYALKNEGQYGKTEMWYIMDAKEGAFLYYGFKEEISKEEFEQRIKEDTLLEVLNAVPVHKGDVLFIEAGTIHAIGQDILIAEIQQNSNVTYRVYDFGRVGKDGKKRELHVDRALDVTQRCPVVKKTDMYPHIADCDYFTVDKLNLDGATVKRMEGTVTDGSFLSILVLDGHGTIKCGEETVSFQKGDSLFLPADSGAFEIEGKCDGLMTTIREKSNPVKIGIDIGGTDVKMGLVDGEQNLFATRIAPTHADEGAEAVVKNIAENVLALLEEANVDLDQCIGAGVGMPGTVDRKNGVVVYSNNISWKDVPLAEMLSRYLPVPVRVANDADCAALGEVKAGAAREVDNAVLLTLGTGVGGGVILDGDIYEGRMLGGSEIGHMVIVADGRECTCGRCGCLEAYASGTALKKIASEVFGKELTPKDVFDMADAGDAKAQELVDDYISKLGVGVVNVVNIFRPQAILLGGGICRQGEKLLAPIRKMMAEQCFGGTLGEIPEIKIAELGNDAGTIGAANLF